MSTARLTPKQEAFCLAYVATADAPKAYKAAYNATGSKDAVVWVNACRLRRHPMVAAWIQELREKAAEIAMISHARVLQELANIALFDPIALFDADGNFLPIHKMSPATRAAIASITIEETNAECTRLTSAKT